MVRIISKMTNEIKWICRQQKTRLECVFSTRFLNSPKDFAVSQIPCEFRGYLHLSPLCVCAYSNHRIAAHPNQDALLLTFDDAKLSIVVFNESERCLETVSLHSYEDEYLREGFTKNSKTPIIRVSQALLIVNSSFVPCRQTLPTAALLC